MISDIRWLLELNIGPLGLVGMVRMDGCWTDGQVRSYCGCTGILGDK